MKRKIMSLVLLLIWAVSIPMCASAVSDLPMVVDNAELLSSEERIDLEEKALSFRDQYEMDVVILTVESMEGKSARNYADDYYDDNGYGCGDNYSGLLFLLAMDEREWYISTCGDAIYAFTDYSLEQLGDAVVPYLSEGQYYEGFSEYLNMLPGYMKAYEQAKSAEGHNGNAYPGRQDAVYHEPQRRVNIWISLGAGVVVSAIAVLIMVYSMNTRRRQSSAGNYIRSGSYHLRVHRDMFLYSNVSKVRRQENNGGGGGGSSVHRSSSGRSHGGRGGKF